MARHINIKNGKPQLFGRAPWPVNDKHSDAVKNARYHIYFQLLNHYYSNNKSIIAKPIIEQKPVVQENAIQSSKTKWLETIPHWIAELFTREKESREVFSGTA